MDERRFELLNDRRTLLGAQALLWLFLLAALWWLLARDMTPRRAGLAAFAIVTLSAVASNVVVALSGHRALGHLRWPGIALAIALFTLVGHALFATVGLHESLAQDAVNLTIICAMALVVRTGWTGTVAHRQLSVESARRQRAEAERDEARGKGTGGEPVLFKIGHRRMAIDPNDIVFIQAEGNFSTLHTTGGTIFASELLKALTDRLANAGFSRVHKSFAVNTRFIQARGPASIELKDGRQIPVGRVFRDR